MWSLIYLLKLIGLWMVALSKLRVSATCRSELCNGHGICQSNHTECRCIKQHFDGEFCDNMIQYCTPNPCLGNGICKNAIGQALCWCKKDLGGATCERKEPKLFKRLYMIFNVIHYKDVESVFMIVMEDIGEIRFKLLLTTQIMIIDAFETDPQQPIQWQMSNNLPDIARNLGLKEAKHAPFTTGFYHISKYNLSETDPYEMYITVIKPEDPTEIYFKSVSHIDFDLPEDVPCVPQIEFLYCSNPNDPLLVDITVYNSFRPLIRRDCSTAVSIIHNWSIYLNDESVKLHSFEGGHYGFLKVPPYQMYFTENRTLLTDLVIRIESKEETTKGFSKKTTRCFVHVMKMPVMARIRGGSRRDIRVNEKSILDGSESRDFILSPDAEQTMYYKWDCHSTEDPKNEYCHDNIGSLMMLEIPSKKLKLNKNYNFTLSVFSMTQPGTNHSTTQLVTVIAGKPCVVDIKCVRNCQKNQYIMNELLHLQALCLTCSPEEYVTYLWKVNGQAKGTEQRFQMTTGVEKELFIEVIVSVGSRTGTADRTLIRNDPPVGGRCSMQITDSIKLEEKFKFQCNGYIDNYVPITYQFMVNDLIIGRGTDEVMVIAVPETKHVNVRICDSMNACTTTVLNVDVPPMQKINSLEDLQDYLDDDESNIKHMIKRGDADNALIMTDMIISQYDGPGAADLIMEQLEGLEIDTLLNVERMTSITHKLFKVLKPIDNQKAKTVSNFLDKVATGMTNIIKDGEIMDIDRDSYATVMESFGNVMAEVSQTLEDLPMMQVKTMPENTADPLDENYPNFQTFDTEVLDKVDNWLSISEVLNKCIKLGGYVSSLVQEPHEPPLDMEHSGSKMRHYTFEGNGTQRVETSHDYANITMDPQVISELQSQLKSEEISVQVVSTDSNPFWWYPTDLSINTGVFTFNAFSRITGPHTELKLKNPIMFDMNLIYPSNMRMVPTNGTLMSSLDVPIFRIIMPLNSLVVIRFIGATAGLRIKLRMTQKPRGFRVRKSKQTVEVNPTNTTFTINNDDGTETYAYIAVMIENTKTFSANVTFNFTQELRECLSWDDKNIEPQWTAVGCKPTPGQTSPDKVLCSCYHLSTYAGRAYPTIAELTGDPRLLASLPINYILISFYILLTLFFLCVLLFCQSPRSIRPLYTGDVEPTTFDLIVHILTGGQWNAGTTANIFLTIITWRGSHVIQIHQDPRQPQLIQNSTCTAKLPVSADDLSQPAKLIVSNDYGGRYPTWYCRKIVIEDIVRHERHTFQVERWISKMPIKVTVNERSLSNRRHFINTLEVIYTHWFEFQPLFGPWRNLALDLNRFERACIWVCKFSIMICIIASHFGKTTLETYEDERDDYSDIMMDSSFLIIMCFKCCVAVFATDIILRLLLRLC